MKFFALLFCATLAVCLAQSAVIQPELPAVGVSVELPKLPVVSNLPALPKHAGPVAPIPPNALPTLKQDLKEIKKLLPTKELGHLVRRYLLNDAEFQGVIRAINSYDAFLAVMRLKSQPEFIAFNAWMRMQLKLSGGSSSEDDNDDMQLINKSPFWGTSVYGWQGFITEFMILFPEAALRQTIELKAQQGGSFTEFWTRVKGLQPLFERFIMFPETQRVVALLQEHAVDTVQIETLVRNLFGWVVPAAPVEAAPVEAEPVPAA